jgi:transmembrane sensor
MTVRFELPEDDGRQARAAAWFARWRSGQMTPAELDDVEAWLRRESANREAFEDIASIWEGVESTRRDPSIMALREKARRSARRKPLLVWMRPVAAVLIVAGIGFGGIRWMMNAERPDPIVYTTAVGQTSSVELADGSKVILDADSAVKVWPRMVSERRLELVRGRAFFEVAKDPHRPFIVQTDRGSVTAVGTAFDVRRSAAGMKIVLLEGRVRIAPASAQQAKQPIEMAAGYEFVDDGARWSLSKTDSQAETSWIRGDLIFDEQPLSVIVEELNRYGPDKIVISDPEVGRRRLSAVLKAGDNSLFLSSVQTLRLAAVERTGSHALRLRAPK